MKKTSMKETKASAIAVENGSLFAVTPDGAIVKEINPNIPLEQLYDGSALKTIKTKEGKEFGL